MTTNGSFGSSFGFTRRRLLALGAATSASAMFASPALAQLRLDVTQGNVAPIPMAIPDFIAGTPGDAEVARVLVRDGRAVGVALASGEEYRAPIVASNADARVTNPTSFPSAVRTSLAEGTRAPGKWPR